MTARRIITLDLDDRARALARIPLLSTLPQRELEDLAVRAHVLGFSDGDVIVPEGEEGLGFYVILTGAVAVHHEGATIATLTAGDFFGEISLLEGEPRTATVMAVGQTTCVGILRSFFKPLLVRNPRFALQVLDEEARRTETLR
jgi:CRP/FNR family transcriptional regulator, cyclic AMP receptor protein